MRQTDLSDFGDELRGVKTDEHISAAVVDDAQVMRREDAFEAIGPLSDGSDDEGLRVEYRLTSGRTVKEWYVKPRQWDLKQDLVLLFEYWGLDPGDIEQLRGEEEVYEVPVTFDEFESEYTVDTREIERTLHTRELEEADNE